MVTVADDFLIPVPASIEAPNAMPLDEAIDLVSEKLGLPSLGGPSGRGWSYFATAQRCPHLFRRQYIDPGAIAKRARDEGLKLPVVRELRTPAIPLQVGAAYHMLSALYYGHGLGESVLRERGLIRADLWAKGWRGRPKRVVIPANAADRMLDELKAMSEPLVSDLEATLDPSKPIAKRPSGGLIAEAEKAFDAHSEYYGSREDVEPLAIEWLAENHDLGYTCRYDMIGRVGQNDPLVVDKTLPAGSVVIYERKTAAYLSEMAQSGWFLEGEILGELLNWKASGCEQLFGPLGALVVDVVTKSKVAKFLRVIVPPTIPPVADHERWIKWTQGELAMYAASGAYPKRFTQCFDRWGRCGEWDNCARGES